MDFVRFNAPSHPQLMQWASYINNEAEIAKVPPCALAAIVWRETGGRNILQEGVAPGPGCGVGLCQITDGVDWTELSNPKFQSMQLLQPADNLYVAAAYFLHPAIFNVDVLKQKYPATMMRFGNGQDLFYAFAEYNAGAGAVESALIAAVDPDTITTNAYASDTLAKYFALIAESRKSA